MGLKAAIVPVTPFQQNCSLWWEETTGEGVVVDPGGEPERILHAIGELKITVGQILLTHGHLDHAGGAMALQEALPGRPPIIGPDERDRFLLEGLEAQGAQYGFECRNVTPDRWLAEGDTVRIGAADFDVLHCPGHTPGHLVFVSTAQRIAIVGDVLFQGSVGRTDFPYGDHAALIEAITTKLLPLGDEIAFLCGHGPGSSFGQERRTNPFIRGA
ncbi:MBL fold metallo-hydrolase [Paracraurococcus lichenis]|uniref:MBL fold metallo-hydrolase n=1 Tax=Paracraurococcus lichenis TaxID=3064888 RepID=A0ABT9DWW3_9PROT|nr:MBL fold metallo-hydrolase [Paracraurococcus sp. LOR1-02]MDO9708384.1 MBL fold metallo-hydrolase [Paracraurococcus sp. LOR1-02]